MQRPGNRRTLYTTRTTPIGVEPIVDDKQSKHAPGPLGKVPTLSNVQGKSMHSIIVSWSRILSMHRSSAYMYLKPFVSPSIIQVLHEIHS